MSQSVDFEFNSLEKIICFQEKTLDILCKITFFITCTKLFSRQLMDIILLASMKKMVINGDQH